MRRMVGANAVARTRHEREEEVPLNSRGLLECFIFINSFRFELGVYARMWPVGAVHGLDGFVLMATRAATEQHSIPSNPLHTIWVPPTFRAGRGKQTKKRVMADEKLGGGGVEMR